jgi:hypothetical protein
MADTQTVVTERTDMVTVHQTSQVVVVLMTPVMIVLVRALRVYVQTLTGLLGVLGSGVAATVGVSMTAGGFFHILLASASIAVAPAVMSILLNTGELLTKWDASHPMLRA